MTHIHIQTHPVDANALYDGGYDGDDGNDDDEDDSNISH